MVLTGSAGVLKTPSPPLRRPRRYLVHGGELRSDGPGVETGAVPEPPRGSLPAAVDHPPGGLLPVQRSSRRFVPSELGAALPVAMGRAGLPVQAAVMAAGARRQPLGDVLGVCGGAALGGTPVKYNAGVSSCVICMYNLLK